MNLLLADFWTGQNRKKKKEHAQWWMKLSDWVVRCPKGPSERPGLPEMLHRKLEVLFGQKGASIDIFAVIINPVSWRKAWQQHSTPILYGSIGIHRFMDPSNVWSAVKSLSHVQLFATPWTVAYQALPSMGCSKQEYWSRLPFPSPGDLPNTGIKHRSPKLQADALPSEPPGKSHWKGDLKDICLSNLRK